MSLIRKMQNVQTEKKDATMNDIKNPKRWQLSQN